MDTIPQNTPQDNIPPETTYIYSLIDPRNNAIRYIGKANNPESRLKWHIRDASHERTHKGCWIASLLACGLFPRMEIIEHVPFEMWSQREAYWINYYLEHGYPLTNTLLGSEGKGIGIIPLEVRVKQSMSHKGKKISPETKAKMSAAHKGRKQTPEQIDKRMAVHRGKKLTPEQIARISETRKGTKVSKEARAKMATAHRGLKHSPESRAKISLANKGRKMSPEQIAKGVASRKGRETPSATRASHAAKRAMKNNPFPDSPTLWD